MTAVGAVENIEAEGLSVVPGADTTVENEAPRMATRRSMRRSAAANLDSTTPVKPEASTSTPQKSEKVTEDEDETMVDIEEDTTAVHRTFPPVPRVSSSPAQSNIQSISESPAVPAVSQATDLELLALGLRKTSSRTRRSEAKQTFTKEAGVTANGTKRSTPASIITNDSASDPSVGFRLRNDASNGGGVEPSSPVQVEYFARVHTATGIVDIPMTHKKLDEEALVVQRYAEWMKTQGSLQVSFETFKSIFSIAKKG